MTEKQIFAKIDILLSETKYDEVYKMIQETDPPEEWIIELDSKIKRGKDGNMEKFKTVKYEVMEMAMLRIFGVFGIDHISDPVFAQDRNGRFAVTVKTSVHYKGLFEGKKMYIPGIATEVVSDISMLQVAVPKAATMANKNAIKQLGKLFGKGLNKEVETEMQLPDVVQQKEISPEEMATSLAESIAFSKSISELKSFRLVVYAKNTASEIRDLYETRLRELMSRAIL